MMIALCVFTSGALGILSVCYYALDTEGAAVRQSNRCRAAESAYAVFAGECCEDDHLLARVAESGAWPLDKPAGPPPAHCRYFCRITAEPDDAVAGLYHVCVYVFPSSARHAALASRITPEKAARAVHVMRTYLSERE